MNTLNKLQDIIPNYIELHGRGIGTIHYNDDISIYFDEGKGYYELHHFGDSYQYKHYEILEKLKGFPFFKGYI